MFGTKANNNQETANITSKILITTTENIPGKEYEIIDIISVTIRESHKNFESIKEQLRIQAIQINADAVVSINIYQNNTTASGGPTVAYGTAVKYIEQG